MCRFSIALIAMLALSQFVYAATGAETQNWECAIDMHQGDNGTLSLQREGDAVDGMISVTRNDTAFESKVSGNWTANEINLKRLLDADSNEPMAGIVVTMGTKKIKIGGRFSTAYQGVWSADCDLVSTSGITEEATPTSTEPSTSSRVTPNNPTDKDRLKFSARATHPEGIKSVSFFLGKKKIHSCDTAVCDFSYGPIAKGNYKWRVEAVSKTDVTNSAIPSDLIVRAGQATGKCTISGLATGTAAELSSIYLIKLFGPDNKDRFKDSISFSNGRYEFSNLPAGSYVLTVDTRADQSVLVTPSSTIVNCQAKGAAQQDFDFR